MYSERAYFDGDHCHHCATRDEHKRLERIRSRNAELARSIGRRQGSRAAPIG
jgi:hypothetical protein